MATQRARVLVEDVTCGIKNGQVIEADSKLIKSLASSGTVDPAEEAVAYALSVGAEVVVVGSKQDAPAQKQDDPVKQPAPQS